jgi:hypothetical protein
MLITSPLRPRADSEASARSLGTLSGTAKLGPDRRDKRSVISVAREDVDRWLYGTIEEALHLLRLTTANRCDAAPLP